MHYMAKRKDLLESSKDLFEILGTGKLNSNVNHTFPLRDVGEAHRAIEARETTGSIVLIP